MSPCIRKKMTTPRADESLSLLSGSTVKDQTYARHLSNPNIRDIDVLLYCGSSNFASNLIPTHLTMVLEVHNSPLS
jgi:hypothetical protein